MLSVPEYLAKCKFIWHCAKPHYYSDRLYPDASEVATVIDIYRVIQWNRVANLL